MQENQSDHQLCKAVSHSSALTSCVLNIPATLIFQALRICVNGELDAIAEGVFKALKLLSKGGIIGAISFHSLEDRIVKNIFKEASATPKKRDRQPILPLLRLLTKKPLTPSLREVRLNPRARSAKLRFAEKL